MSTYFIWWDDTFIILKVFDKQWGRGLSDILFSIGCNQRNLFTYCCPQNVTLFSFVEIAVVLMDDSLRSYF